MDRSYPIQVQRLLSGVHGYRSAAWPRAPARMCAGYHLGCYRDCLVALMHLCEFLRVQADLPSPPADCLACILEAFGTYEVQSHDRAPLGGHSWCWILGPDD